MAIKFKLAETSIWRSSSTLRSEWAVARGWREVSCGSFIDWWDLLRIIEYPELEGTHKVYRTTQKPNHFSESVLQTLLELSAWLWSLCWGCCSEPSDPLVKNLFLVPSLTLPQRSFVPFPHPLAVTIQISAFISLATTALISAKS